MSGGFVMLNWWNELNLLEQILACIAVPSTLLLVIQLIMTIIGLGDDADGDVPDDIDDDISFDDTDGDIGLRVFTIRGLTAFFTLLGWVGLSVSRTGANSLLSIGCGVIAGIVAMFLIALLVKYAMKLQDDGTIDYRNALGLSGNVYITIPANPKDLMCFIIAPFSVAMPSQFINSTFDAFWAKTILASVTSSAW